MPHFYEFDSFRVDSEKRLLWRGDETISLKPKTFDTLLVLLKKSGKIVTKEDLVREVWNGAAIGDDNLTQHVSRLRKILGENPKSHRFIVTLPGVGYKFIADVCETPNAEDNGFVRETGEGSPAEIEIINENQNRDSANDGNSSTSKNNLLDTLRKRPVSPKHPAAVLLAIVGAALFFGWQLFSGKKSNGGGLDITSIAVLPFKIINADADSEGLKIGMADALITRLARLERIKIVPTSRVAHFDKDDQNSIAAGRELGVDAVLESRIQKNGERLRVTAQLIKIANGKTLWAENYEEDFSDIFDVQTAVARKVAETLALELSGDEERALMKRYTSSAEAYRLYLEATYLWQRRSGSEARVLMQKNYQRAIELDPNFALAYVGLANMQTEIPSRENYQKARVLAEQALAIDETLGEAHESVGFALWRGEMNWAKAETYFRRALELSPNSPDARQSLAMLLAWQNRFDEAFALIDAYPSKSNVPTSAEIALHFYSRNYDKTIELANLRLEKKPNDVNALSFLSPTYTEKAMHAEAIATAERYMTFDHVVEQGSLPYLGFAYARAGQTDKAREIRRQIASQNALPSAQINGSLAFLLGALGEKEEAFVRLEKAIEAREFWAFTLKVSPQFDSLRDDPRFDEMLARVNLQ